MYINNEKFAQLFDNKFQTPYSNSSYLHKIYTFAEVITHFFKCFDMKQVSVMSPDPSLIQ